MKLNLSTKLPALAVLASMPAAGRPVRRKRVAYNSVTLRSAWLPPRGSGNIRDIRPLVISAPLNRRVLLRPHFLYTTARDFNARDSV